MKLYSCSHTLIVGVQTVAANLSAASANCGHCLSIGPYLLICSPVARIVRYIAPMMEPQDPIGAFGRPSHVIGDASRYLLLFTIQTIGAAILFWYAIPLSRQFLLDLGGHAPRSENLVWSLFAIILIQAGYWDAIGFGATTVAS